MMLFVLLWVQTNTRCLIYELIDMHAPKFGTYTHSHFPKAVPLNWWQRIYPRLFFFKVFYYHRQNVIHMFVKAKFYFKESQ